MHKLMVLLVYHFCFTVCIRLVYPTLFSNFYTSETFGLIEVKFLCSGLNCFLGVLLTLLKWSKSHNEDGHPIYIFLNRFFQNQQVNYLGVWYIYVASGMLAL